MADFSLTAVFGMDSTGLKTELKSLRKDVNSFVNDWAKLGAGAAIAAFAMLSKGAMELAGSLADASANIGINVESLQALQAQHKRNGVSNEELTKALQKTKKAVLDAAEGDDKAEASLAKLGLTSAKLIALPLDKQYEAIAVAASKAKDQGAAYSAVCSLLGEKVGPKLMGSLKELGEEGLPGVTASAREAGQVMSAETIVALDRAGDAIDDFKKRATVAVGDIIVNFRSEEGLKLLGMQLLAVLGKFGGGILDAIVEAGGMIGAVFKGAFIGTTNYFNDALVEVIKGVATLINKVLPKNFEVNVGNLDLLKSSGQGIGDAITEAIAKTSPSTFKKDFGESWDAAIADQRGVVDALNAVDLGKDADKLRSAGDAIGGKINESMSVGNKVLDGIFDDMLKNLPYVAAESGEAMAEPIMEAVKAFSSAIARTGTGYRDQSTTALRGVRDRVASQLSDAQWSDRMQPLAVGGTKESFATSAFASELFNIEKELSARKQFGADFDRMGETKTLAKYGDAEFQRYTRDMQDTSTRTTNAIETIARGLAGTGIIRPN